MKVLITGGAGFIGSHIVEKLLQRGDEVLVIDNYTTGRKDNLKPHTNLQIVEGTICNVILQDQIFAKFQPQVLIHAAASYKDPHNWIEDAETNVAGTATVCQIAKKYGVKRIIYFQTALCYGLHPVEQPITLNHPILPGASSYAISKTAGEQYIHLSGLDYVTFRLANVYGPRNLSGPLPTFYKRLTTNQPCFVMDTRRDFVFVDDVVACVLQAVDGVGKGTYHLSNGQDIAIMDLFQATIRALKMQIEVTVKPRHPDDAFSILLDPVRAVQDFGWSPKTGLDEGVRKAIAYYQEYGVETTFTHLQPEPA